jgi:hypothetical protein
MYLIQPKNEQELTLLAAYLNSSIGKLFFEVHGRIQYGGLVQVTSEDLKDFPIINPRKLSPVEQKLIIDAFEELVAKGEHEDQVWSALLKLDKAILSVFGLEEYAEEIAQTTKSLSEARQEQREYEIPVEVEREETFAIPGGFRLGVARQTALDTS